jgi:uncharacterized protein (TIGR03435 family)
LVLDPNGPKLKPPAQDFDEAANRKIPLTERPMPMTLDRFAEAVAFLFEKPVVNQTAPEGRFMLPLGRITIFREDRIQRDAAARNGGGTAASLPDYSSVFAALKNVGLKIETRKSAVPRAVD